MDKKYYVECDCDSAEHVLRLAFSPAKEDFAPELTIEPHLRKLPFWDRLKNAVRYVCGIDGKYGDYEEIFWANGENKQALLFATILVKYIRAVNEWNEQKEGRK